MQVIIDASFKTHLEVGASLTNYGVAIEVGCKDRQRNPRIDCSFSVQVLLLAYYHVDSCRSLRIAQILASVVVVHDEVVEGD